MTGFLIAAGLMVAVALSWLLPVLLRGRRPTEEESHAAANLAVLRDQLAELERDVARGTLSPALYQQSRDDLDRRVLEEMAEAAPAVATAGRARGTALVIAVLVPLCAGLLYWQLGSPGAIGSALSHAEKFSPAQVEEMVSKLAARLEQNPDDGNGWALLARSYMVMQRFDDAAKAYERATTSVKDSADLYADYADALAMTQGRRIEGKPLKLVEEALRLDPNHWKALAMAGSAAFDRKDYKTAVRYWETLLARVGPESEFAKSVTSNIAEARELGGIKGQPVAAAKKSESKAQGGAVVRGTVSLSPAVSAKVDQGDTVFIFARPAEGSRMPLALVRKQVKDLPVTFTLDDSMAMSPQAKLSNYPEVIVGARISKSGGATPQSGDIEGVSGKIRTGGTPIKLVIDRVVP
jgi:cytochrome c-type biogenesis protein CcmH